MPETGLDFNRLPPDARAPESIAAPPLTYAVDVWRRFRRRPTALAGLLIIALLLLASLFGPMLSPHAFDGQNLAYANLSPILRVTEYHGRLFLMTPALKLVECDAAGNLLRT